MPRREIALDNMRVKLKQKCCVYNLDAGYEFEVTNQDDGFYTDVAFYQGWIKNRNGHRCLATFDQKDCEVIDWRK